MFFKVQLLIDDGYKIFISYLFTFVQYLFAKLYIYLFILINLYVHKNCTVMTDC